MKPFALDSKPEEPLTHDSRAHAGRLNSATPIPVSYLTFTHRVSSEHRNESVDAMTCSTPDFASVDQCNQQYSIYALTDSSGNVSERYAYTAYGQPTFLNASATVQASSAAGNRYTYTSREWDQTIGLHHFRARWMSGWTGRFLTRDPTLYYDGPNIYSSYVSVKYVDPLGWFRTAPPKKLPPVLNPGESDCYSLGVTRISNGLYDGRQMWAGVVPYFFQWSYQLAGTVDFEECKRCCADGRGVTDRKTTISLNGLFTGNAGVGFQFKDDSSYPGVKLYGYLGVKLEMSLNISLAGSIQSDRCSGKELDGEICASIQGNGRVSGGGMISIMSGWFNYDIGAEVYGGFSCATKVCYSASNNTFTYTEPSCGGWEVYGKACWGICYTKRLL